MDLIRLLRIRDVSSGTPDTIRIFNAARESCERLNAYLVDFIETVAILRENGCNLPDRDIPADGRNPDEYLAYMDGKIQALLGDMERIAADMPELVELVEFSSPLESLSLTAAGEPI